MREELTIELTDEVLLRVLRGTYFTWMRMLAVPVAAAVLAGVAVTVGYPVLAWGAGAMIVAYALMFLGGYWRLGKVVQRSWQNLPDRTVRYTITDDGIDMQSPAGGQHRAWDEITRVQRLDDLWMAYGPDGAPWILPAGEMDDDTAAFLNKKLP